jgi:ElaB/YqjD/DUF883 family membrane-anchored ribosome-binding protein
MRHERNKLMDASVRGDLEQNETQAKLESAIERAKVACQRLEEKTVAAAKATDKVVREHPYQAIGIGFGIGILIGVLAARSRCSED